MVSNGGCRVETKGSVYGEEILEVLVGVPEGSVLGHVTQQKLTAWCHSRVMWRGAGKQFMYLVTERLSSDLYEFIGEHSSGVGEVGGPSPFNPDIRPFTPDIRSLRTSILWLNTVWFRVSMPRSIPFIIDRRVQEEAWMHNGLV